MLVEILFIYLRSVLYAFLTALIICVIWTGLRVIRKSDKTVAERQAFLYDTMLITILTTPVISFAYVGIILMLKA